MRYGATSTPSFFFSVAATSMSLQELVARRDLWPAKVTLKKDVRLNGVGKLAKGTEVRLQELNGPSAVLDAWIGYYRPYATSHEDLDKDPNTFESVKNAALSLVEMVRQIRIGQYRAPDEGLEPPAEK